MSSLYIVMNVGKKQRVRILFFILVQQPIILFRFVVPIIIKISRLARIFFRLDRSGNFCFVQILPLPVINWLCITNNDVTPR